MSDIPQTRADATPDAAGSSGAARPRSMPINALAHLLGIPWKDDSTLDGVEFATRAVREREILARAGDPCDNLYVVRGGCFKTVVVDAYGSVQGTGFPMKGGVIGADGLASGIYASDAVALDHGEVVVIPVTRLDSLSRTCRPFPTMLSRMISREIVRDQSVLFLLGSLMRDSMISREIVRDQSVLFLLGSLTAEARVAAFLLNLSEQFGALGFSRSSFLLKMTRQDIGHYLGLTIETVSRALSALTQAGFVAVQHREVAIVDRDGLKRIVTRSGPTGLRATEVKTERAPRAKPLPSIDVAGAARVHLIV